jgi:hypothetical protein
MKHFFSLAILLFSISVLSQTIYSQGFPYDSYKVRAMSEMVGLSSETDLKGPSMLISKKPHYSAIRVEYTGRSQPLSKEKLDLYKTWQKSLGVDAKVLTLLDREFLFKECDKEYWVSVQKQVAAYFPKELKEGDKITLYLMAVGGVKKQNEWEYIFLTNEFKKY